MKIVIFLICLLGIAQADDITSTDSSWSAGTKFLFTLFLLGSAIAVFLYFDRKNDQVYSRWLRGCIGDLIMKIRNKRSYRNELSQKVETQENPTARISMSQHQKTYIEAQPQQIANPGTSQQLQQEVVLPEQIKSDTPEPDFKGVFEIKESKSKHKANKKKSKSKLKGRLLGKGSDNEQDQPAELSNLTDQNDGDLSRDVDLEGSLSEEYKTMEDVAVEEQTA